MTNHFRRILSESATTALSEDVANLVEHPTRRLLDTGQFFLGGSMCRLIDAHELVGTRGERLVPMIARGATIALGGAQQQSVLFAALAATIRRATGLSPNFNVYLTGPRTAGVAPHIDSHDVAALHLAGRKAWLLGVHETQPVLMTAGDLLLLPSGLRHTTVSVGDELSIHIAINCERRLRESRDFFWALRAALRELDGQLALAA